MRKAGNTEKGKPERNGRRSREIGAQAVRSKLERRNFDLGRARWMRGGCGRMNGQAKDLSDRNACFIYDTDERGSGIGGECSLIFAYVRLLGEKFLRALRAKCTTDRDGSSCNSPLRVRRAMSAVGDFSIKNERFNSRRQRRIEADPTKSRSKIGRGMAP